MRKKLRTQKILHEGDYFEMFSMKILTFFPGCSECMKQTCYFLVAAKGKYGWLFSLAGFFDRIVQSSAFYFH